MTISVKSNCEIVQNVAYRYKNDTYVFNLQVRALILKLMEKPSESWVPVFLESLQEESPFAAERILAR